MVEPEHRSAKSAQWYTTQPTSVLKWMYYGQLSVLEYTFKNYRLFLARTEVPPVFQNEGLGTKLAHAALEYARQNDFTVVAICPFVKEYVGSHPEYQPFVTTSVA